MEYIYEGEMLLTACQYKPHKGELDIHEAIARDSGDPDRGLVLV
jgi:hypothetical protein